MPADGQAAFAPGGYHLMLIGLTRTLKAGDQVPRHPDLRQPGAKVRTAFAVGTGAGPPAMGPMRH